MLGINVKLDIERAKRDMSHMRQQVITGAAVAMQRVAVTVRKEASLEIRDRLSLKPTQIKDNIAIYRPYGGRTLIRDIKALGAPIPLKEYSANRVKKGVTYRIGKGKPRKLYIRQNRKGFINPSWGGGHVYVATGPNPPGPANAPIKKVYGPSVKQAFVARRTVQRMTRVARERWPIEFNHQLQHRSSASFGKNRA